MSDTLITIGITCYREGDLLRECWDSVLAQTDDRWVAVLVMDGGADEKTREVFASIEHPKVVKKFAFEENVGPYPVRNKAFEITETPYHFYLDGDDMLPPGCIAAMYRTIEQHPEAAYVYGDYTEFPSGTLKQTPTAMSSPNDVFAFAAGCGVYSVDTWRRLGGFSGAFARGGGDTDLKMSMYEAGMPMYHCGGLYYVYRIGREDGVFSRRSGRCADVALLTMERHPVFFRDGGLKRAYLRESFCRSIWYHAAGGDRIGAMKYLLRAFRYVGIWNTDLWFWAFYVILGRNGVELIKKIRDKAQRAFGVSDGA